MYTAVVRGLGSRYGTIRRRYFYFDSRGLEGLREAWGTQIEGYSYLVNVCTTASVPFLRRLVRMLVGGLLFFVCMEPYSPVSKDAGKRGTITAVLSTDGGVRTPTKKKPGEVDGANDVEQPKTPWREREYFSGGFLVLPRTIGQQ